MARESANSSNKSTRTTGKGFRNNKALKSMRSAFLTAREMPILGNVIIEFIGTFLLTVSLLAVLISPLSLMLTAMFMGFAVIGIVLLASRGTAAHLNPAVTVGAWVTRKITGVNAVAHILAQLLGATIAWFTLSAFLGVSDLITKYPDFKLFQAGVIPQGKEWYILFAELIGSIVIALGFAAAMRTRRDRMTSALTYGFAVFIAMAIATNVTSFLIPASYTGLTFLNPAIAAALNGLALNTWPLAIWPIVIYIITPVVGGIIGFVIRDFIDSQPVEEV